MPVLSNRNSSTELPRWFLIALAAAWILPGLVGHEPWKPDEAYSFGLVYHILQTGDWIVPTLAGEPFMEKPPLFYLTAALFAKLFSGVLPLHDGARLATGFYMALALFATALTARELYGRVTTAVLALLACLGLAPLAHLLITDMALLAGLALGLYGFALGLRRNIVGGLCLGTGAGIAFLAKGLIGPGLLGLVVLLLPTLSPAWRKRAYFQSLAAAAVAALPWLLVWPIALYLRSPELFMTWLWDNNLGRFLGFGRLGPRNDEPFFYVYTLLWFAWPSWLLAAWTLWSGGPAGLKRPSTLLPLAALATMLAVLSVAADGREVYALPLLLPLALLAAPALGTLPRVVATGLYGLGIVAFFIVAAGLWFAWAATEYGLPAALAAALAEQQPGYTPATGFGAVAIAVFYSIGGVAALYATRRFSERSLIAWVLTTALLLGLAMTILLPWLDTGKAYRGVFTSLKQALPTSYRCVAGDGLGEPQRAMLDYYAGIRTHRVGVSPVTSCDLLLLQEKVDEPRQLDGRDWELLWRGARPGDAKELFRLFRRR
ncbi:MAG: glycosyltransferase family 39 protein [Pseudomonadota bacterium]